VCWPCSLAHLLPGVGESRGLLDMAIYTKGRDPAYHPALRLADRLGLRIALHLMIAGVRGMLLYIAAVNFRAKRLLQASGRFALITAMLVSSCQRIGWQSQRLIYSKHVPFAPLTRADQGGTQRRLAGACQGHRRQKISTTEGKIRRDLASCFLASIGFPLARADIQPTRHHACVGESRDGTRLRSTSYGLIFKR
jgi:hypothetical protein